MDVNLVRRAYLPAATLGVLLVESERFETIERPWLPDPDGPGGQARVSCIPDGVYTLRPWQSPKHGAVWIFEAPGVGVYATEVPAGQAYGRSHVLLHAANEVAQLEGCIAPGMRAGILEGKHWVYESRRALERIGALLGREVSHRITIRPSSGTAEPL